MEEAGGPLSVVVAGANVHKLLTATLQATVVQRPKPTIESPQHLCLDKAYDNPTGHQSGLSMSTCLISGVLVRRNSISLARKSILLGDGL